MCFYSQYLVTILTLALQSLEPPINPHEWARLKWYAQRVRSLHYDRSGLDRSVFELLQEYCGEGAVFPNLQEFYWQQTSSCLHPELSVFMSSSLHTFSFATPLSNGGLAWIMPSSNTQDSEALMEILHRRAPCLRRLLCSNIIISPAAVDICANFTALRSLRLSTIVTPSNFTYSPSLIPSTAKLDSLDIDVSLLPEDFQDPETSASHPVELPSLTSLSLHGSLKRIQAVLRRLTAPQVHSVGIFEQRFHSDHYHMVPEITPCIETVVCRFKRLQRFRFVALGGIQTQLGPVARILEPLLRVRGLLECRVYLFRKNMWSMDDEDLLKMCKAWPQLHVLHLEGWPSFDPWRRGLILKSLSIVARSCRQLTSLRIPVDGGDIVHVDDVIPQTKLRTFAVSFPEEVYSDILALASYINRLFPSLDLKSSQQLLQMSNEADSRKLLYKRLFTVLAMLQMTGEETSEMTNSVEDFILNTV